MNTQDHDTKVKNEGYTAQAQGKTMQDNPYPTNNSDHWLWRQGYIEAFKDSH